LLPKTPKPLIFNYKILFNMSKNIIDELQKVKPPL